jgi:hypothetical protein
MDNKPNFPREVKLQWAGSRERNLASGRGGTFFLTSLFIERFDPATGDFECNGDVSPTTDQVELFDEAKAVEHVRHRSV